MKNYSVFSKEYETLFTENYLSFCKNIVQHSDNYYLKGDYGLFFPSCGSNIREKIKFIFYGQAVRGRGWDEQPHFRVTNIDKPLINSVKEYFNTAEKGETNPLEWVENNWTKPGWCMYRSFFWNVCYKFINRYNNLPSDSPDWYNHLIWSNLMKISPTESGNPDEIEWEGQLKGSIKLFKQELLEVEPEYAILLTNWDWAKDFLSSDFSIKMITNKEFILAKGKVGKTKIIVTKRPYPNGSSERCVNELFSLL
jgi:hypothetical protein